jgi:ribonuclease HII
MIKPNLEYEGYHWDRNKGYLTPDHIKAVGELGVLLSTTEINMLKNL